MNERPATKEDREIYKYRIDLVCYLLKVISLPNMFPVLQRNTGMHCLRELRLHAVCERPNQVRAEKDEAIGPSAKRGRCPNSMPSLSEVISGDRMPLLRC